MCAVEFLNKNQGVWIFLIFLLFSVCILVCNMKMANKPTSCMNVIFSICALIFSILSLCQLFPRTNLGFDYMGVIVGILSLLVAVLIGWNIYSVIDMKNLKEETERRVDKLINERIDDISVCLRSYVDARDVNIDGMRLEPALSVEMLLVNVGRVRSRIYKELAEKEVIMKLYFICYVFHKDNLKLLTGQKTRYIEILNGMGDIDKKKEVIDAISNAEYIVER